MGLTGHFDVLPITLLWAVSSDISDNQIEKQYPLLMKTPHSTENLLGSFDGTAWHWHLKRNISMAPLQLAKILAALALVTLIIGVAFLTFGASLILPFSLIEITALFVAFLYNLIHANDYETLVLSGNDLKIERKIGLQTHQVLWVRSLTRIEPRVHANELIQFRQGQESMSFGKFIHANSRPLLSQEIAARLLTSLR
ncbi:MAG: hypothetical protein RL103_447 [Pseudomonadota bacterium]